MSQFILPSRATDANNNPLSGALLYFYLEGTTTPADVFADAELTTAHPNPVVANAGGQFAAIYTDPEVDYRAVLKSSLGITITDYDPYTGQTPSAAAIDFIQSGTGATPTTVQAELRELHQYPSGQFYADYGAKIQRLRDRVFMGDAALSPGTNSSSQPDWLSQYQMARGRENPLMQSTQVGITNSGQDASLALLCGARTGSLYANYNAVAVCGIGVANRASGNGLAWGGYFEVFKDATSNNGGYGIELDTINFGSTVTISPYAQNPAQTVGLQVAAGGEFSSGVSNDSAAIAIRKNGASFMSGIIFGNDALAGTTGNGTGTATAIQMACGHTIKWHGPTDASTSQILSTAQTQNNSSTLTFSEGAVGFANSGSGKTLFQVVSSSTYVNFFNLIPNVTGGPVQIAAAGDDANVGIQLAPKGTAQVLIPVANVPNFANDAAAASGGVPVNGVYRNGSALMIRVA